MVTDPGNLRHGGGGGNAPTPDRSARTLETILTSIRDHVVVFDHEWRYIYVNDAATAVLGRPREELIGRCIWDLFPEAVGSAFHEALLRARRERRPVRFEDHDPSWNRWFDNHVYPGGEGVTVLSHDITERKESERKIETLNEVLGRRVTELRASEERFRLAADAVNGIIYDLNLVTGRLTRTRGLFEVLGYRPEEAPSTVAWWVNQIHPEDRERVLAETAALMASDTPEFVMEYRVRHRDGRWVHLVDRSVVTRNAAGRIVRQVGCLQDVTQTRRAEASLKIQNERLRLLSEAAGHLLTSDDPDAIVRGLFEQVRDHLGVDAYFNFVVDETGTALTLASCAGVPEEMVQELGHLPFGQTICGAVALERRPIAAIHIQQSDDPSVQLARAYGFRVYACSPLLAGDKLLGTLSFASRTRDSFEDDELGFIRALSHYVAAAYERVHLIDRLREADRRKDEFLAILAHELRNPLAPIVSSAQYLRLAGPSSPELDSARAIIERQANQLTRLVDDLLDVSRIARGKLRLRTARVAVAAVVEQALETSRPVLEATGHELVVSLSAEPLWVEGDRTRLGQVVANLLNNAAKYTAGRGTITLAARREGGEAVLTVRDTGVGIPAEMLPRVFEMFTQVDDSTGRAQGGLGIGLTLVRRLVELHGGSVVATSDGPGRGSEFVVRLPLAEPCGRQDDAPRRAEPAGGASVPGARRSVLVVDDHADSTTTLARLLRRMGHDVITANDGPTALEAASARRPDLMLVDLGMPGMSGFEVARRIRTQDGLAATRLVALTGWGQAQDRQRTRDAGFDDHLVKPVDLAELERLLATLGER